MPRARWTVVALALFALPARSWAEPAAVRLSIPAVEGKSSWGTRTLERGLARGFEETEVSIVAKARWVSAQKKLRLRGKAARTTEALAQTGREAEAHYVLQVRITKKGWLFTARARLINTESGEVQMDFKAGYYKPKSEAADRGRRIAQRTIEKLSELIAAGEVPAALVTVTVAPTPTPHADDHETRPRPGTTSTSTSHDQVLGRSRDTRLNPNSLGRSRDTRLLGRSRDTRLNPNPPTPTPTPTPTPSPTPSPSLFRITLSSGAGFLHRYDLSTAEVGSSRLSFSLTKPVTLFAAELELVIPKIEVGLFVDAVFSPVRFVIEIDGEVQEEPSGSLLDLAGALRYHGLWLDPGRTLRLIPGLGVRHTRVDVAESRGNFILSQKSIVPFAGLTLRWLATERLELDAEVDGGWVATFTESPVTSGDPVGGYQIDAQLGLRIWLSSSIGIAVDARFDHQSVRMEGLATRQSPADELLMDARVTSQDLRGSFGLALRL